MALFGDIAANTTFNVPAGSVVGDTDTQTLTNKQVIPRSTLTSTASGSFTPNADTTDLLIFQSGITGNLTLNAPTVTSPKAGQWIIIQMVDDGSAHNITFNAAYQGSTGVPLPATTLGTTSNTLIMKFMYDFNFSKWSLVWKRT